MIKINHSKFTWLLNHYYDNPGHDGRKIPIIVKGGFGIGKSFVVRDTAKEIAGRRKRKFVEWLRLSSEEKQDVVNNPKDYFVLIDIRLSEYDSSDIKGLPGMTKNNSAIEWYSPLWAKFMTHKDSDGVLFFDEMNLAPPTVLASTYKILYDRVISEDAMSDNWLIVGAGNREEDGGYSFEIPPAVSDRAAEVELTAPNASEWTDWAMDNGIDNRIIAYINYKPGSINVVDQNSSQKSTTARGWARVSGLISGIEATDRIDLVTSTAIGEGIAKEFSAFCKIKDKVKLDDIIDDPKTLAGKNLSLDVLYFLVSAVAERFALPKTKNGIGFDSVMEITRALDGKSAELGIIMWRLCKKSNPTKIRKEFDQFANDPLLHKYIRYIA